MPHDLHDPLLDCLIYITNYHNNSVSRSFLIAGMPLVDGRLTPNLLEFSAKRAGLTVNHTSKRLMELGNDKHPKIIFLDDGNSAAVLLEVQNQIARVYFPSGDPDGEMIPIRDLKAKYAGSVMFLKPRFTLKNLRDSWGHIRQYKNHWFWRHFTHIKPYLYCSAFVGLFLNALYFAIPALAFYFDSKSLSITNPETLIQLTASALFVLGTILLIQYTWMILHRNISQRFTLDLTLEFFEIHCADYGQQNNRTLLTDFDTFRSGIKEMDILYIGRFLSLPLLIIPIGLISAEVALVATIHFIVVTLLALRIYKSFDHWSSIDLEVENLERGIEVSLHEQRSAIHQFGALSFYLNSYLDVLGFRENALAKKLTNLDKVRWISGILLFLSVFSLLFIVSFSLYQFKASIELSIATFAGFLIVMASNKFPVVAITLNDIRSAYIRISHHLQSVRSSHSEEIVLHEDMHKDIHIDINSYEKENSFGAKFIENLNIQINAGNTTGIIGDLSSGKLELLRILAARSRVTDGSVKYGSVDIDLISPDCIAKNICYISSLQTLVNGTIRENLTLGNSVVTTEMLDEAMSITGLKTIVENYSLGLDQQVGTNDALLSTHEKCLLIATRGIISQAKIWITEDIELLSIHDPFSHSNPRLLDYLSDKTVIAGCSHIDHAEIFDDLVYLQEGSVIAFTDKKMIINRLKKQQPPLSA